jgi:hypothetical protein
MRRSGMRTSMAGGEHAHNEGTRARMHGGEPAHDHQVRAQRASREQPITPTTKHQQVEHNNTAPATICVPGTRTEIGSSARARTGRVGHRHTGPNAPAQRSKRAQWRAAERSGSEARGGATRRAAVHPRSGLPTGLVHAAERLPTRRGARLQRRLRCCACAREARATRRRTKENSGDEPPPQAARGGDDTDAPQPQGDGATTGQTCARGPIA